LMQIACAWLQHCSETLPVWKVAKPEFSAINKKARPQGRAFSVFIPPIYSLCRSTERFDP
jgi:hypothetical protein